MKRFERDLMPLYIAKGGCLALSVLFCLTGLWLILEPAASGPILGRVLGAMMTVFGVVRIIGYFSNDLYRLAFQYDLELGILSAALGVTTLLYPERIMNVMAAALGLAVLADGLFRIRIAQDARRFGLPKWGVILALAAAAVICGALLMLFPETGARTVTVFLGITLLADGLLNLWVTGSAVRIFREHRPEIVDADGTWKEAGEAR